MMNFDFNIENH